ncbi:MAG: hypothetical protein MZV70_36130 [Desulfobacterales bacterium]|nr:hypothetical protein [Desulfobacterales bacterium]
MDTAATSSRRWTPAAAPPGRSSEVKLHPDVRFDRGIEVPNGADVFPICPSDIIERTVGTIDNDQVRLHHFRPPQAATTRPGSASQIGRAGPHDHAGLSLPDQRVLLLLVLQNTIPPRFQSSTPAGGRVTKIGTRDDTCGLTGSLGIGDNTTAITATYRKVMGVHDRLRGHPPARGRV